MKSQTFYSISDPQSVHVRPIPELRNKKVWTWLPCASERSAYFLGEKGDLTTLVLDEDIEDEPSIQVLKVKKPCSSISQEIFLVEYGGELLSVVVGKAGKSVQVFKFNQPTLSWEVVESLGTGSLYISGSSFASEAKIPGMEKNKIYFPRLYGESIIFYSIATGKFHTSKNEDSLPNYNGTREQ